MDDGDRKSTWLVFNSASGSHIEDLDAQIAKRLAGTRFDLTRNFDCQSDAMPDAAMALESGVSLIIVHGGDGTMNAMAKGLAGWDGAILPLPGGTANLLCHRLYDPCEWEAIMDRFVDGVLTPRRIDSVVCEDHLALSEMLVGPAALWADAREELRDQSISGVIESTKDAASQSSHGPFVRIVSPELGREDGYPGIRFSPAEGGMHIQGYAQDNLLDLLKQGLAILSHDFRQGPHDDLGQVHNAECRSLDGAPMELMVDGERASVASGAVISVEPLKVDILCAEDS